MKNKELAEKIRKEMAYILLLFLAAVIIFKIAFYNESLLAILRTVFALFWTFILAGFIIMYQWHEKLDFTQRVIIGIPLGIALIGIGSYFLGLAGLNIKYHTIALPLIYIILGTILISRK